MRHLAALLLLAAAPAFGQVTVAVSGGAAQEIKATTFACLDVEFTDGTREIGPCVAAGAPGDYARLAAHLLQNDARKKPVKSRKTFALTK